MIPVARNFIELPLGHKGGLCEQVAPALLLILHKALQRLDNAGALGQQDGQALTDDVHGGEQLQLAAQLVVVALFCLLQLGKVGLQVSLLLECGAVDALEHLVLFAAAPVGAGNAHEPAVFDPARGGHVGSRTEVHKLALTVEADDRILRKIADELDLVGLALFLHEADGFLPGQLKALEREILLRDLFHLLFDLFQIVLGKGLRRVKIVVKAVFNGRADGQLDLRIQALDRLRQQVGGGVPVGPAAVLVGKGVELQRVVARHGAEGVAVYPVDGAGQCGLGKAGADGLGHGQRRYAVVKRAAAAVRECDEHAAFPP